MKIRSGFVSNSSSSSFVLSYKGEFHKVVPKYLEKLLKDKDMYSHKNLSMLTRKVQEHTYDSMSEYKRIMINRLTEEAKFWFEDVNAYSKDLRKKWKVEEPEEFAKHEEKMILYRDNPILAAEQMIQGELYNEMDDTFRSIPQYLTDGYKVCTFDLEYGGDCPDENKYIDWKQIKHMTSELVEKLSDVKWGSYVTDTDEIKLLKVY